MYSCQLQPPLSYHPIPRALPIVYSFPLANPVLPVLFYPFNLKGPKYGAGSQPILELTMIHLRSAIPKLGPRWYWWQPPNSLGTGKPTMRHLVLLSPVRHGTPIVPSCCSVVVVKQPYDAEYGCRGVLVSLNDMWLRPWSSTWIQLLCTYYRPRGATGPVQHATVRLLFDYLTRNSDLGVEIHITRFRTRWKLTKKFIRQPEILQYKMLLALKLIQADSQ